MPRIKTRQAVAKRFIKTKKGKYLKRHCGQDHFNARESGKTTRHKRRDVCFTNVFKKAMESSLPRS